MRLQSCERCESVFQIAGGSVPYKGVPAKYQHLLATGYIDLAHTYYTDGLQTEYGTMVTELEDEKTGFQEIATQK